MRKRPRVRDCEHEHGFPLCACHEPGLTGVRLLDRSRYLSSLAGWPSPTLDEAFVAEHQANVAVALEAQQAQQAEQAAQSRQSKPRVPLGVNQHALPPPDCPTCP